MRQVDAPMASAEVTNSRCRSSSTSARTVRRKIGMREIARTRITLVDARLEDEEHDDREQQRSESS